ncbi:hypothetical protein O181_036842 [Austropuccinia psidii MF-1]|uniref:RING-type domain-containing protein n=1 Tax=Austropuccinia psidii MF-1 TaxID=1389203 RepID=A0A9Q3HAB2_9BASI|nr:hypothetical protein [Austropuccinia psidii MF-1]
MATDTWYPRSLSKTNNMMRLATTHFASGNPSAKCEAIRPNSFQVCHWLAGLPCQRPVFSNPQKVPSSSIDHIKNSKTHRIQQNQNQKDVNQLIHSTALHLNPIDSDDQDDDQDGLDDPNRLLPLPIDILAAIRQAIGLKISSCKIFLAWDSVVYHLRKSNQTHLLLHQNLLQSTISLLSNQQSNHSSNPTRIASTSKSLAHSNSLTQNQLIPPLKTFNQLSINNLNHSKNKESMTTISLSDSDESVTQTNSFQSKRKRSSSQNRNDLQIRNPNSPLKKKSRHEIQNIHQNSNLTPSPSNSIPGPSNLKDLQQTSQIFNPIAQVQSIIPDVTSDYAQMIYKNLPAHLLPTMRINMVIDHLIQTSYPKSTDQALNHPNHPHLIPTTSKVSLDAPDEKGQQSENFRLELNEWLTKPSKKLVRSGPFIDLLIVILSQIHKWIPIDFIKRVCLKIPELIPAWLEINDIFKKSIHQPSVILLKNKRPSKPITSITMHPCYDELKAEYQWLCHYTNFLSITERAQEREQILEEKERTMGILVECQCCFDSFRFLKMIQCPEGHLFCQECIKRNVEINIGANKADIRCMDSSQCDTLFTKSELRKVLPDKHLKKLNEIEFEKSLDLANLEGLEKCPFCPWAVIIENPQERLLRCGNQKCQKISCRFCKRLDHIPKTCDEIKKESLEEKAHHQIAEAMSSAVIRHCPQCQRGFIKESGCNKIRCMNCGTLSCYICQKVVSDYGHFDQRVRDPNNLEIEPGGKCPLWDDTNIRHHQEITQAHQTVTNQTVTGTPNVTDVAARQLHPGPAPRPKPPQAQVNIIRRRR